MTIKKFSRDKNIFNPTGELFCSSSVSISHPRKQKRRRIGGWLGGLPGGLSDGLQ